MRNIIILPPWQNIPPNYLLENGMLKENTKVIRVYSKITHYVACIFAIGMFFSQKLHFSMETLLSGMLALVFVEITSIVTPYRVCERIKLEGEIRDGLWGVGKNELTVITTDSIYQLLQNSRTLDFQKEADACNGLVQCSVISVSQCRSNG